MALTKKYLLKGGDHTQDGKTYKSGDVVETTYPLSTMFPQKFSEVDGKVPAPAKEEKPAPAPAPEKTTPVPTKKPAGKKAPAPKTTKKENK